MINKLELDFKKLLNNYCADELRIHKYWVTLYKAYTSKHRYYHNFYHIDAMFQFGKKFATNIEDYDMFCFAIWYHDIVYKATKSDNEAQSAKVAQKHLKSLKIDQNRIENCQKLIISTKKHEILISKNADNAYLLDLDLSILGTGWDSYSSYIQNIRKEYAIYPDFMYKKGRKKVLHHFLDKTQIYYTSYFQKHWEKKARQNMLKELEQL